MDIELVINSRYVIAYELPIKQICIFKHCSQKKMDCIIYHLS